jgi:excisionase family DNA binding protein
MTPEEVAELLAVPPKTVTHWARIQYLPGLKLGRRWRFLRDDIETWLRADRRRAA